MKIDFTDFELNFVKMLWKSLKLDNDRQRFKISCENIRNQFYFIFEKKLIGNMHRPMRGKM